MDSRALLAAAGLLVALAAGCGDAVGSGGQQLPPPGVMPVDLGAVVERTTKTVEVPLVNPSETALQVWPPAEANPFRPGWFEPIAVGPGARFSLPVTFAPEAPGEATGELEVRTSLGALVVLELSGVGVADLGLACDEQVDFGPRPPGGPEAHGRFRCENLSAGETRLRVGRVEGDGRQAFRVDLAGADGPRSLAAGATLEVPVTFLPPAYPASAFAWVEVYREDDARRGKVRLIGVTAEPL